MSLRWFCVKQLLLLVIVVDLVGCAYPEAILIDAPLTTELQKSEARSFEDRSEVVESQLYRNVLQRLVLEPAGCVCRNRVDEKSLAEISAYLKQLQHIDLKELSRREQLSTLINAHNAFSLYQLLQTVGAAPSGSPNRVLLKDFRSRLAKEKIEIAGTNLLLSELRNGVVRPYFKDPRVQFAMSDGTSEFAPFHNYPLSGNAIKLQLETAVRERVTDPRYVKILSYGKIEVAPLFWRAKMDIADARSNPHAESIKLWLHRYADDELRENLDIRRSGGLRELSSPRRLLLCDEENVAACD